MTLFRDNYYILNDYGNSYEEKVENVSNFKLETQNNLKYQTSMLCSTEDYIVCAEYTENVMRCRLHGANALEVGLSKICSQISKINNTILYFEIYT